MKVFNTALVVAIAWICPPLHAAPEAEINKSYKLPVLSVSPGVRDVPIRRFFPHPETCQQGATDDRDCRRHARRRW